MCFGPPATSASSRRRPPSLRLSPPCIVAALDLQNPGERSAHDLLLRFTSGRWPLWRLLGMCRDGASLRCAVEWLRCRESAPYSLAELSLTQPAVCWREMPTAKAARAALAPASGEGGRHA